MGDDVELVDRPHPRIGPERQAQTASHRLLGEYLRGHRPEGHDDGDVLDVPALLELVDAHDRERVGLWPVELVKATLGGLVVVLGVHLQHGVLPTQVLGCAQQVSNLGRVLDVSAHDEGHRVEVASILPGRVGVVVGLFEGAQLERVPQLLLL